jgi:outer membrane protein
VNKTMQVFAFLVLGFVVAAAQSAAPPNKVGVIHFENAIASTQQGQKALTELSARYEPKQKELEKQRLAITALQEQLNKGKTTMSAEAQQKLADDIDTKTKALNRDLEYAQSDYQQDMDLLLREYYPKVLAVLDKYAKDNGYAVILDISSQQSPVMFMAETADVTNDIVALYDKNNPLPAGTAPAKPAATSPSKPATPAPKP